MKQLSRLRPSPAMVVACLALTVALGGTSYAAITLPKNTVGTKQLKKNAVTGPKIKADAVTSPKVAGNALTGADINEATLATVPSATSAASAIPVGAAGGGLTGAFPNPAIGTNAVGSANVVDASQAQGLRKADLAAIVTTVTFDPSNTPANSCGTASVIVPGAQVGDTIVLQPTTAVWGNLIWAPWSVSGANVVNMRVCNPTNAAFDGIATNFTVLLIR